MAALGEVAGHWAAWLRDQINMFGREHRAGLCTALPCRLTGTRGTGKERLPGAPESRETGELQQRSGRGGSRQSEVFLSPSEVPLDK